MVKHLFLCIIIGLSTTLLPMELPELFYPDRSPVQEEDKDKLEAATTLILLNTRINSQQETNSNPTTEILTCKLCPPRRSPKFKSTRNPLTALRQHLKKSHDLQTYRCPFPRCTQLSLAKKESKEHIATHDYWPCNCCSGVYQTWENYHTHKCFQNRESFFCKKCDHSSKTDLDLFYHDYLFHLQKKIIKQ